MNYRRNTPANNLKRENNNLKRENETLKREVELKRETERKDELDLLRDFLRVMALSMMK